MLNTASKNWVADRVYNGEELNLAEFLDFMAGLGHQKEEVKKLFPDMESAYAAKLKRQQSATDLIKRLAPDVS